MSGARARPVSSKVLDAAIAWQLCLDCGQGSEAEHEEFAKWYAANEEHARAWMQLGMLDQRFAGKSGPARSALLRSREGVSRQVRKLGRGVASIVLVCGLTLFLGDRYLPIDYWLADQRTATGEQRTLRLTDNTLISLNTHSALDVRFDDKQRRVILQEGEILVETGSHDDPRPFIVETRDGQMRALGTRFLVKREDEGTLLSVLQSAVAAHTQTETSEHILHEGQQMLIRSDGLGPMLALTPGADAWTRGMLVVDNAPLRDVVAELGRYRQGYLGVASDIADLRITGSFPLNNTDLALKALIPTLPVLIEQRTQWWVTVVADNSKPTAKPAVEKPEKL
ncbi:MAG TPA: FecR family protein [Pseudomonas sp.]|uniref:FecR family protein n=1 Tax=Pseudomonas sp. TaxID=306 RepID=UPI002ED89877